MKIVINEDYGGYGLSDEAVLLYGQLAGIDLQSYTDEFGNTGFYIGTITDDNDFCEYDIARDDGFLIEVVETLGDAANSKYSSLKVVEIPDDVEWQIEEYAGNELIAEKHRTWS